MVSDRYKLKDKSNKELRDWLTEQAPGTDEYHAGEEESMRRVAAIEEAMESAEEPSRKREMIAIGVAIVSLVIVMVVVVFSF